MTLLQPVSCFYPSFKESPPFLILSLGGSAAAAGELVAKQGGKTIEYLFIIELAFLNPRSKLHAPVYSIIQADDDATVEPGPNMDACAATRRTSVDGTSCEGVLGDQAVPDLETSKKIGSMNTVGLDKGEFNGSGQ
jgi:hypothetical protein